MKRPALYLSILFITIIGSTALVSTTISGICRTFYNNEAEKNTNVKSEKPVNEVPMADGIEQASVKF